MKQFFHSRKDYEDLRKDIIEVKIDYKSWIRMLKIIGFSVTVILALLAYFGYDKIDSLEKTIIERTNQRLAKSDSLLSKIDEKKIADLNLKLVEKEKEYTQTINNLEHIITQNKQIEDKILSQLPNNKRIDKKIVSLCQQGIEDLFEVRKIQDTYKQNEKINLYLIFDNNYNLSFADAIHFQLLKGNTLIKYSFYQVEQRFNKIEVSFDIEKGEYNLEFGFISKSKETPTYYRITKKIKII